MKKQLLLLLVFSVFFVSGCTNTEQLSQSELFDKKQECGNYKRSLQKEIDKNTKELSEAGDFYNEDIIEIFYSISKNSCFAITESIRVMSNNEKIENKKIIDMLSNDVTNYDKKYQEDMTYYYEKIKELKKE